MYVVVLSRIIPESWRRACLRCKWLWHLSHRMTRPLVGGGWSHGLHPDRHRSAHPNVLHLWPAYGQRTGFVFWSPWTFPFFVCLVVCLFLSNTAHQLNAIHWRYVSKYQYPWGTRTTPDRFSTTIEYFYRSRTRASIVVCWCLFILSQLEIVNNKLDDPARTRRRLFANSLRKLNTTR